MPFFPPEDLSPDLINSLALLGLAAIGAAAYLVRAMVRGKARYARIDKDGGSSLVSKDLMAMTYWMLQPVARLMVSLGVTPNMISWISFALGLVAGLCLAYGHFGFGAVFATVSALMDSLDGLVARMSGRASDAGEVLDAAIDRYAEFFYLMGLGFYYREIPVLFFLVMACVVGSFMVSYSTAKAEALQVEPPRGNMRRTERAVFMILGALLSPISIPWLERSNDSPVALGYPMLVALLLVGVLSNVSAVERLWAIAKLVRARDTARRELETSPGKSLVRAMGDEFPEETAARENAHDHSKI